MTEEQISKALDNLLKFNEIHATVLVRRNGITVMPDSESFKPGVNRVWDATRSATDKVFDVIQKLSPADLTNIKIHLEDYQVLFHVFPDKENILITVVPTQMPNIGTLEVEIENTSRNIQKILEQQNL